ncbi:MAG TPA: Clp protease N-terminal domain-containing protein, partial [Armatimonadota bacterium]|nr:Clp protease N-terminal domain-containing protein [Armatimonadota bacterium]
QGDTCCIKYPEYPYFLAEADEAGTPMPITRAIAEFASKVPSAYRDNMDRPTISFWRELMTREVVDPRRATAEHSGGTEPWQRFSSRARRAVVLAHNEAMGMGMPLVDTEHVLMGLVSLGEGAATEVLEGLGVALDRLAADLRDHLVHGSAAQEPNRELAFTPQAQRVLHVAYAESKRLEHDHVGTEHLLIGLVHEGRGAANRLLRKYGVDLTRVRAGVCRLHEGA